MKVETLDANGNPVSTVGEYHYDGDGRRIKKHVPSTGELTVFVYDAGRWESTVFNSRLQFTCSNL